MAVYKISDGVLIDCRKSIIELSALLEMSHKGSKLNPKQVDKAIEKGVKLLTMLNSNFDV